MTTQYMNLGVLFVDILVSSGLFAVIGMIIVLTWGKEKTT